MKRLENRARYTSLVCFPMFPHWFEGVRLEITRNRGRSVALVFSMQGIGQLLVPVVGMICLYSFGRLAV